MSKNAAELESAVTAGAIILDTKPPVTTATPSGGTYGKVQNVTLSANEAATNYYTTNGIDPTESAGMYNNTPIPVTANDTLKFFAKDAAGNVETIKSQSYTIYTNGIRGDLDGNETITLADAILALKVIIGMPPLGLRSNYQASTADLNGDNKVGMPELLYILQKLSDMR